MSVERLAGGWWIWIWRWVMGGGKIMGGGWWAMRGRCDFGWWVVGGSAASSPLPVPVLVPVLALAGVVPRMGLLLPLAVTVLAGARGFLGEVVSGDDG